MGYIYLRTNRINGKKYVGLTTDLKTRQYNWNNLNQPYAGNVITNARAKYGIDAFDFEILKECNDNELDYWEKYYIKELNTKKPYGYNMTEGGDGCPGYIHSEETRKKISESLKGKTPWIKGKHLSEETKKKLSIINKGKKLSEDIKKKIGEAQKGEKHWNYGKHWSEEDKEKLSESHKGKKQTEETKLKRIEKLRNGKLSKTVLQINKDTNEVIAEFPSVSEVERQLGISISNVSNCCNGKRNIAGGYKWQYK